MVSTVLVYRHIIQNVFVERSASMIRSLLFDFWLILANPTQESRSMERRTPLRSHCQLHSDHDIFHHRHNPNPILHHRKFIIIIIIIIFVPDVIDRLCMSGGSTDFFELFTQINVNNDNSLIPPVQWLTIANNALYTAIDFISQLILVSVFVTYINLSLLTK